MQIEALDSQNSANRRRICEQELFFRNFCRLTPDDMNLRVYLGTKNFVFFLVFTLEFEENRKIFEMKTRIVEIFELKTVLFFFFFWCLPQNSQNSWKIKRFLRRKPDFVKTFGLKTFFFNFWFSPFLFNPHSRKLIHTFFV